VSFIRDQARAVPREVGRAIAGVNGDFYVRDMPPYSGDPAAFKSSMAISSAPPTPLPSGSMQMGIHTLMK